MMEICTQPYQQHAIHATTWVQHECPIWDCPGCGKTDNTGNFCGKCGHPAPNESEPAIAVGQSVFFGHYPQTAAGTDKTPIEWLVLDYDAKNNKALLISRYALDCKQYNTSFDFVTWETCTLRTWLNSKFLDNAFNSEEKKAILKTTLDNSKSQGCYDTNGGKNTQDKVFLLSYAEAWKYFKSIYARKCAPTDYAIEHGAWTNSGYSVNGRETCWWWLRSPGSSSSSAARVLSSGTHGDSPVSSTAIGVRPALWIDLSSDIF